MSIHKSCRKMYPDFIVSDFITEKIKTITVRPSYKTIRVTIKTERLTDKNLAYCGLTILTVVCRKGCLVDLVDLVVKSAPKNTKLRTVIPVNELFARETFFYNTILQELEDFQEEIGVKASDRFQGAPVMLVSSAAAIEEVEETLILQNAESVPHFERWSGDLTQEHVLVVLKELSKLHALTFAFAQLKPERVEVFKERLQDKYFSTLSNDVTIKVIEGNIEQFLRIIDDSNVAKRLKKFKEELPHFLQNILSDSSTSIMIHGDPTDSFIFTYEDNEDKSVPTRAKLTEWQLTRFGSPILDLSLFLMTNASDDILTNLHSLLKFYHSSLRENLQKFQCDVEFSWNRLEEEWKKFAKYGLAVAFLTLKILSLDPNKRPNANNEELTEDEFVAGFTQVPNEDFVRKMKSVVKYCVTNDLI